MSEWELAELEISVGYVFEDRSLLSRALTHASFKNEADTSCGDNERLEFLGDAVLELALTEKLFGLKPPRPEGELTQLRARVVNGRTLAGIAQDIDLGRFLRLGKGEERQGGRRRHSVLANALESVIGAVHVDGGFGASRHVVHRLFAPALDEALQSPAKDVKSRLQEWSQSHHRVTPRYRIVGNNGPDHAMSFVAEVEVRGAVTAQGRGRSKKLAQLAAAEAAIEKLGLRI